MAIRHLLSALFAVLATPFALALVDFGLERWRTETLLRMTDATPAGALAIAAAGLAILCLVAAAGRLSGVGPLLAGLVWGVAPALWLAFDYGSFFQRAADLPRLDGHSWLLGAIYLFPMVGALLIGAGLGGRWRAPRR